jgi:hypothetical protein
MAISKTTIETLNNHHKELYGPLVEWLNQNVPVEEGYTPFQNAYEYLYSNWNVLGPRTKNPEKQSTYIDYIMMVIFNGDSIGYILQNSFMNDREDKFIKFYNRLDRNLKK